jgi:CcmD family protein
MKRILLLIAILLLPTVSASEPSVAFSVLNVKAHAGNQRVDLTWDSALGPNGNATEPTVLGYVVYVFQSSDVGDRHETNATQLSLFLVNGRPYAFQVAARLSDGTEGPRSGPVSATPSLERDLEYLAAGLVVTWVAVLGYVGLLVRREARLDRKLEQLLSHRGGRNP